MEMIKNYRFVELSRDVYWSGKEVEFEKSYCSAHERLGQSFPSGICGRKVKNFFRENAVQSHLYLLFRHN